MHLQHLQGVLTLCFAKVTKLLKLQLNKISRLKCSRDHCWMIKYMGWSFNSGTDFFSGKLQYVVKWQQSGTRGNSVQVYVQNRRSVSPHIRSVEALGWTSTTVCVAFHNGGGNAAACVHWFLFPSGENCCWNIRNAASSFRRVLPKLIEDIWVVFPFQKWMPILWRRPPPRHAFHLPHRGDRGTCARNRSCWPTSDYQRGCRGS